MVVTKHFVDLKQTAFHACHHIVIGQSYLRLVTVVGLDHYIELCLLVLDNVHGLAGNALLSKTTSSDSRFAVVIFAVTVDDETICMSMTS
jgi:hypothetical protein